MRSLNKLVKLWIILVIFLLLLQSFLYFTNKYGFDYFVKKSINNHCEKDNVTKDYRISWENQSFIEYEAKRKGNGEQGLPFELQNPNDIRTNDKLFNQEGFFVLVSDKISLERALPDKRPEQCKQKKYLRKLKKVSIIISFHNEIWSVLLRCIHSIINRSPSELLHEIILINDASTFQELYEDLYEYVKVFHGKVKIQNNVNREGLIKSRMIGARLAKAEIIVFLDSHMEVTNNWLPPLLEPIVLHPTYATVPIIESINHATFAYEFVGHGYRGTFDWNFRYQWLPLRKIDKANSGENYELSSMTGGAYAIRRDHFFHLGGYDEELKIWNGENYEISLKLWLCSGGIFSVPCSRIAHLSKLHSAYRNPGDGTDFVGRNLKRIAEVWLDDYKMYFYREDPERYKRIDAGNLEEQLKLKKSLNCKPFKFFLDVVAPEMLERYPILPQYFASGAIKLEASEKCIGLLALNYHETPILVECGDFHNPRKGLGFTLTFEKSIRYNDFNDQCLDATKLKFNNCHHMGRSQYWKYDLNTRQISNRQTNQCLTGASLSEKIFLHDCDITSSFQIWKWSLENVTALNNWNQTGFII